MVYRVYVEKKAGQTHEADSLLREIKDFLQIDALSSVRVLNRYDAENIEESLFNYAVNTVFSEPQVDNVSYEVPTGEVGEICISGSTTMSGYWNEEGIEKMGLYIDENGTEWVRSGDLGYKDEDGFLFFAGRKKRLIIISGYNVYPVDIENLMDTLPFIKESCAVSGKSPEGKPLVRLYVSLKTKGDEEAYKAEIIKTCEENLDKFSVPREIVFMHDLPHTPLEKVDFMALEKLDK